MRAVLAVSGGVDSMVMLDIFKHADGVMVAHFDHGIREGSAKDCIFVAEKAREYGLKFISEKVNLGAGTSEAEARQARYDFLLKLAKKEGAEIFVAQHFDDLAETIAINLQRGTGWRGLAAMSRTNVRRPFIDTNLLPNEVWRGEVIDKNWIYHYAAANRVTWRLDTTNYEQNYLRNRIRSTMKLSDTQKRQIVKLFERQRKIRCEIENLVAELQPENGIWQRAWFNEMEDFVAVELLKFDCEKNGLNLTRPDLARLLNAIRSFAPGKQINLPKNRLIKIQKNFFKLS